MWKSVLVGALVGILVLVLGLGGYLYVRGSAPQAQDRQSDRTLLIFESRAEDDATVAALISLIEGDGVRDISPETTVSIPGTSYNHLSDALAFGGGGAVLNAFKGGGGEADAFVSVPESVWRGAVDARSGITVDLPVDLTVFDGSRLSTLASGEQTMTSSEVGAVLRGIAYLNPTDRSRVRHQLSREMASALISAHGRATDLKSSMSGQVLESWLQNRLAQADIHEVD